ncbi:MAG TPA: PhzF family phenazine biosynthesis protein [Solirubrobacteraceae bacterium]|nr:PhzF family phenazine biosynthesis protein [Solirubrobacteraceae bacterium]
MPGSRQDYLEPALHGVRRYVLLDVFTDRAMSGNQLAVFPDADGVAEAAMQRVARELNLSETVFLFPPRDGESAYARIFTPAAELPFAGHPLLGAAVVLARALDTPQPVVRTAAGAFELLVGDRREPTPSATLTHELAPPSPFAREEQLLAALGIPAAAVDVDSVVNGAVHVLVALDDADAVARLTPDLGALAALGPLAVSCFAGDGPIWRTRMFAPALGVAEDPATGSAAGPIAGRLCRTGQAAYGSWLEIRQGEEIGRPSTIWARVDRGEGSDRASVRGSVVFIGEGHLAVGEDRV